MLAPAAFWGGAVPSAAQTAGMETDRAYDAATPSAIESIGIGLLMNRHTRGLQSGGMVGYSTFFTGYDADRHGLGRKISLGRLGAQAVSASARGLMHTPLANSERAASVLRPLTMAHKYGVGGALDSAFGGPMSASGPETVMASGASGAPGPEATPSSGPAPAPPTPGMGVQSVAKARTASLGGFREFRSGQRALVMSGNRASDVPSSVIRSVQATGTKIDVPGSAASGSAGSQFVSSSAASSAGRNGGVASRFYKWIVGVLGGEGFNRAGTQASYEVVEETIDGTTQLFRRAGESTAGAVAVGGTAGRALGAAFRIGAGYEVARLAVDAGTYAAGEAYESMVETTSAIRERVGSDQSMSPAYYNRGAATERQRARRSLNLRSLNPRTQLMGNEASMAHG